MIGAGIALHLLTAAMRLQEPPPPDAPPQGPPAQEQPVPPPPPPQDSPPAQVAGDVFRIGEVAQDNGRLVTRFYRIGHDRAGVYVTILNNLKSADPAAFIQANEETHTLVMRDVRENIDSMEQALSILESPQPQVLLEATLAEVQFDRDFQLGFEGTMADFVLFQNLRPRQFLQAISANLAPQGALAGTPFQGTGFRFAHTDDGAFTVGGLLDAFVQNGRATIKANPRLLVTSGGTAEINSVQRVPVPNSLVINQVVQSTVNYEEVGVKVHISPHVLGRDQIELQITVELSKVISSVTFTTGGTTAEVPIIARRMTTTSLTVPEGSEIAISGITREETLGIHRGIPVLSDIPIVGWLFGRTEESSLRSDLVFVVRPQIFHPQMQQIPQVVRPEGGGGEHR